MTRREFLLASSSALAAGVIPLRIDPSRVVRPLRMAVITDLHHGLAPDALSRLAAFAEAVKKRNDIDLVMQMGDFCYSDAGAKECTALWKTIPHPKIHVLGNHDMDKVDKVGAMRFFGMKSRYGSRVVKGWRFVVLDLNHFEKDGKLFDYDKGNYFTDKAIFNKADPEQLAWLGKQIRSSKEPVILISHQPLGFAEPGQAMPPEQVEVLQVVTEASRANPAGAVAICIFGHLHVDRLEHFEGIPCYCVNSASYFWFGGMQAYTKPLFAFMELTTDGLLKVEGASGEFVKAPPKASDPVIGRSASIASQNIQMSRGAG